MKKKKYFGDTIAGYRCLYKISQPELAEKAGISVKILDRIEKDKFKPEPAVVKKIANALDISIRELMMLRLQEGGTLETIRIIFDYIWSQTIFYHNRGGKHEKEKNFSFRFGR